jgi:YD repeat-containing protein
MKGESGVRAARWVLVFAFLLLASSAVPVLAEPAEEVASPISQPEGPPPTIPPGGETPQGIQVPSAEDMDQAFLGFEQQEAQKAAELESSAAVQEREASQRAYVGLAAGQSEQLLTATFGEVLARLNADPARFLSDARLDQPLGETAAQVTSEGKTSLMEGSMPVQAEDEDGELSKVDLTLEKTAEGYEPLNPLVEVTIADSPEEGVEVGEEGVAISQVGAEDVAPRPFGDKNIFYSEVEAGSDTDLLISPTSTGVEIFDLLRSVESPETLRFHLDLPGGASMRRNGAGGAEVVGADGSILGEVAPPRASDAQGRQVPVALELEGELIVLRTAHREEEVAYPILVDPEYQAVEENWYSSWYNNDKLAGLNAWGWSENQSGWLHHGFEDTSWPGHKGLMIATEPGNLPGGQWGQWIYSAPNSSSYLSNAYLYPFWRNNRNCSAPNPYNQPYDYDGMWNETSWNRLLYNQANELGWSNLESWGRALVVGMSTYSNGISIPCWRDVMVGGAVIWLEDWDAPHLTSVTGIPTGWIKKDNTKRLIQVSAEDAGLGVKNIRLNSPGAGGGFNWKQGSCAGTYENPCANSRSGEIEWETSGFPLEGNNVGVSVQAEDPTGKKYNPWSYTLKVDGASPTITLKGQLASITAEEGKEELPQGNGKDTLSLPTYKLTIEAKDGTTESPNSGVKAIKLYLDNSATPLETKTQTCSAAGNCAMTLAYTLKLPELTEGKHTLKIVAEDQVGNVTKPERKIEFEYIPATGMKEEYVLQHFILPDGHDYSEEPESHAPEIAVNVMNGNVVYHERDIKVTTPRAGLELERIYNSQQPKAKDGQWGHGFTVAQSPEFKPQEGAPAQKATMVRTSAITNSVPLPQTQSAQTFSQKLHATVSKTASGGYEVAYRTKPEVSVFNSAGRIEEAQLGVNNLIASGEASPPPSNTPTYTSSFGTAGTGNGQFAHPAGIAVGANGTIWVVDENHYRVQKFNEAGEYQSSFGSQGSGNGQFARPTDIAVDAKGNLWVTDAGNSRVEKFNEKGEFLSSFGSLGTGNGQLTRAEALAIDSKGNIWVADTYNGRVQEFNEKGEFIKVVGSAGTASGQMVESTGIAIGPNNTVWVTDWGNNKVLEFSEAGAFMRQFGTFGTGNGQFKQPDVIEVDSKGDVWVGDQNNARIQEFNQSGEYVTQFGTAGTGAGQFSFGWPMGVATDNKGRLWISDTGNNRVQKWTIPNWTPTYTSSFGTAGAGSGQLSQPADVAEDTSGNVWVVDKGNNRIEEFNEAGEFVRAVGSLGSTGGKLNSPSGIAIDSAGNIDVTDTANNRIAQFSPTGAFIQVIGSNVNKTKVEAGGTTLEKNRCTAASGNVCQAGTAGSGEGQMAEPIGIATTGGTNFFVVERANNRVEKFSTQGERLAQFGELGSGNGQLKEPTAIAFHGFLLWVADTGNDRMEAFTTSYVYSRKFGGEGSGNGPLGKPVGVETDESGDLWVAEQSNSRVERFSETGSSLGKFGNGGSGPGQFGFGWPTGIATDNGGHLWISDSGNNRVQRWTLPGFEGVAPYNPAPAVDYSYAGSNLTKLALEDPATTNDPSLSVNVTSGLTTSVSGEAAGTTTYAYEAGKLKAADDPEGETKYRYDAKERLEGIELPNGTTATIVYDSLSRATSVTVDPAGAELPKVTSFSYSAEPRQTVVWGGGRPKVTYSIGEDGSVFKWSYAEVPPAIDTISGSLWAARNSTTPVANIDQTLFVTGSSPHEIAKVQVVANGDAILEEKTCVDPAEPPEGACEHVTLPWVTNPAEHAAGQLNLEVVVTDTLEHQTAERFFVTMPQQPPPDPAAPVRPTFGQIKQFREEYGLDRAHAYSEQQLTTLILELLYEWENENPTAMLAVEKWGVPLRSPEVEELEYRERYIEQFAELIPDWSQEHAASTYGGYYADNRAGGVIYVGFTQNQQAQVESLKQTPGLIAPGQIQGYPTPPTTAIATVEATEESVTSYIEQNEAVMEAATEVGAEPGSTTIRVGATNPQMVGEYLTAHFGAGASIQTFLDQDPPEPTYSRYTTNGPLNPGDAIMTTPAPCGERTCWEKCTSNFGARAVIENREGHDVYANFAMTAGHCGPFMELMNRVTSPEEDDASVAKKLGKVRRYLWGAAKDRGVTDAEAIRVDPDVVSSNVYYGNPDRLLPMRGLTRARIGSTLCWSGRNGGTNCGPARRLTWVKYQKRWTRQVEVRGGLATGDSGGPVWNPRSLKAVGIITVGWADAKHPSHNLPNGAKYFELGGITPLMAYPNATYPRDVLLGMGLELVRGDF